MRNRPGKEWQGDRQSDRQGNKQKAISKRQEKRQGNSKGVIHIVRTHEGGGIFDILVRTYYVNDPKQRTERNRQGWPGQ